MTARDAALLSLDALTLPHWPRHAIDADADAPQADADRAVDALADPRDRALAEKLTLGVVKNLLRLQHLIAHYARRPTSKIDPLVQKILAIAMYQIGYLDRVPVSAAVDQAVEQTRRFGRPSASGFANAVLRNALRIDPPSDPDPAVDPAGFAQVVLSHPRELFSTLQSLLGNEGAIRFCEHSQLEPPTIVRLFAGVERAALGMSVEPHERAGLYVVSEGKAADFSRWAGEGLAQVQDPTSVEVVRHLDLQPGQRVLDRCAGRGTKTLQAREMIGASGEIVAMDLDAGRCNDLLSLVRRRRLSGVTVHRAGRMKELGKTSPFDRILIDAPCSNSGVLARRPEARYAQTAQNLSSLQRLQDDILFDTADALKPGGKMIYSTCSIWPEENQDRVAAFLRRRSDYRLLDQLSTLPQGLPATSYHDGGYWVLMQRVE